MKMLLAADYANVTGDGKLNVMGVFREINALNFPAWSACGNRRLTGKGETLISYMKASGSSSVTEKATI